MVSSEAHEPFQKAIECMGFFGVRLVSGSNCRYTLRPSGPSSTPSHRCALRPTSAPRPRVSGSGRPRWPSGRSSPAGCPGSIRELKRKKGQQGSNKGNANEHGQENATAQKFTKAFEGMAELCDTWMLKCTTE